MEKIRSRLRDQIRPCHPPVANSLAPRPSSSCLSDHLPLAVAVQKRYKVGSFVIAPHKLDSAGTGGPTVAASRLVFFINGHGSREAFLDLEWSDIHPELIGPSDNLDCDSLGPGVSDAGEGPISKR
jgi:hypothetical protein